MPDLSLELADTGVDVKLTGGTVRSRSHACVGPAAESFLHQRNFDLLFLGTNGLTADTGLSTPDEDEAAVKRAMDARGIAAPLARGFEALYPKIAAPFGRVVHGEVPAEIHGTYRLDPDAREYIDTIRQDHASRRQK